MNEIISLIPKIEKNERVRSTSFSIDLGRENYPIRMSCTRLRRLELNISSRLNRCWLLMPRRINKRNIVIISFHQIHA